MTISDDWSGEPLTGGRSGAGDDFNINDPDIPKIHYDLSGWTFDQKAELTEALAESELPHGWDDEELVVPESVEPDTDALFERLEGEIGPFAIRLGVDEPSTEFGLDEWPERDRELLTQAVVEAEIPHRWDGATIYVAQDAESEVDDLLDAIEAGELISLGEHGEPPEGALSTLYLSADRLARDPLDTGAAEALSELYQQLDERAAPYGVTQRTWRQALVSAGEVVDQLFSDDPDSSQVIGSAQALRAALRPYV